MKLILATYGFHLYEVQTYLHRAVERDSAYNIPLITAQTGMRLSPIRLRVFLPGI